jgi:hypothetical protein
MPESAKTALKGMAIALFYSHFSLTCLLSSTHPSYTTLYNMANGIETEAAPKGWKVLSGPAGNILCPRAELPTQPLFEDYEDLKAFAEAEFEYRKAEAEAPEQIAGWVAPEAAAYNSLGLFSLYMPERFYCDVLPLIVDATNGIGKTQRARFIQQTMGVSALCSDVAYLTGETVLSVGFNV